MHIEDSSAIDKEDREDARENARVEDSAEHKEELLPADRSDAVAATDAMHDDAPILTNSSEEEEDQLPTATRYIKTDRWLEL